MSNEVSHYSHFEIDIVSALSKQLTHALDSLSIGAFEKELIDNIPKVRGVYQLFLSEQPVYVGKANNLSNRLKKHHHKISGRKNVDTDAMGFKCLSIHENWAALAPEKSLIDHYRNAGVSEWNGIGFGNNDPGRQREVTNVNPDGFDMRYPIRLDWPCDWIEAGNWNILDLLVALKDSRKLPYLLRYKTEDGGGKGAGRDGHYKKGHPDHRQKSVHVPYKGMTAEDLLILITQGLPGWQSTAFPSHIILYPESRDYEHGRVLHRKP